MNEEFEQLPFAGQGEGEGEYEREYEGEYEAEHEEEMDSERGRPRGGARPARAPARSPAPRAGKRPPGGRPVWPAPPRPRRPASWPGGPVYGWPYAVGPALAPPEPAVDDPAADAPGVRDDDDDAADQPQDETPSTLSGTLTRLPAGQRPAYQALGTVAAAIGNPRSAGPGLYLIEFSSNGRQRAYSGHSGNVRKRLQQHLLCARMLGLSLSGHQVFVAPLPKVIPAQRRAIEARIHDDMFARSGGVLTNQRREMEMELLGPQWA